MKIIAVLMLLALFSTDIRAEMLFDFEKIEAFSGRINRSTEQVKEGDCSGEWSDHPNNSVVKTTNIPADWRQYNVFSFWAYSKAANNGEFLIMFTADGPNASSAGDYFYRRFKIDWTGWKHFEIPTKDFLVSREPTGWDAITGMIIRCSGFGMTPRENSILYFDQMERTLNAAYPPSMPDKMELPPFQGKLHYTGMPWDNMFELAKRDPEAQQYLQQTIDFASSKVEANTFYMRVNSIARMPDEFLDKRYKDSDDPEIFAQSSYDMYVTGKLRYIISAAVAARYTGDAKYINAVNRQLAELATWDPVQRPGWTLYTKGRSAKDMPDGRGWLATGYFMSSVIPAMVAMGKHLDPKVEKAMKELLVKEVKGLVEDWKSGKPSHIKRRAYNSNQWMLPASALILATMYLGMDEFREAYDLGVWALAKSITTSGSDGSFMEGYGYSQTTTQIIMEAATAMKQAGDLRVSRFPFLTNHGDWLIHIIMPGKYVVDAFDCMNCKLLDTPTPAHIFSALMADRPDIYWGIRNIFENPNDNRHHIWLPLAFRYFTLEAGALHPPKSYAWYPDLRLVTWRSGWNQAKDVGLWIKGGSLLDGHSHRDQGQISVYRGDEAILIDSGAVSYSMGNVLDKMSRAAGHNILQPFPVDPPGKPVDVPVKVVSLDENSGSVEINGKNSRMFCDRWIRKISWNKIGDIIIADEAAFTKSVDKKDPWFIYHTGSVKQLDIKKMNDRKTEVSWNRNRMTFESDRDIEVAQELFPHGVDLKPVEQWIIIVSSKSGADRMKLTAKLAVAGD